MGGRRANAHFGKIRAGGRVEIRLESFSPLRIFEIAK